MRSCTSVCVRTYKLHTCMNVSANMYVYLGCVFQLHLIHGMPRAVFTGVALSQGKRVLQKRVGERSTTSAFLSVDREKNKQTMLCLLTFASQYVLHSLLLECIVLHRFLPRALHCFSFIWPRLDGNLFGNNR